MPRGTDSPANADSQRRLEAILETAVDGIITIDERGVIDSFNPAAERLFGYTADEAIGANVAILMPEPYAAEHDGYLEAYLRTGEARIIGRGREVTGRRRDGTTFPMHLSISEVPLDDGRTFTGIVRDMSDLVESRRELRRQRDFAESLVETAHAIVLVLDPEAYVVRFNRYMEELTGYDAEAMRGVHWFDHFLPDRDRARVCELFHGLVEGRREVEGAVNAIVTRSGEEREIAWWGRALHDEEGRVTGVLSIGHDVTELKRMQERLVRGERLSAIGEAMTGLTHESRNALARSQANLRMLARRLGDRPELLELIEKALRAQDDVRLLFEEVRQYAAPIVLRREATDLADLVRETWAELEEGERSGAEFVVEVVTPNPTCPVDRFAIRNVFRNLLENALSACGDPGRVRVRITDETDGSDAIGIAVRDNGPGVPREARPRLFDAFFTTRTRGTGLGLSIVRRIVEEHGGTVELAPDDEDGPSGAEFVLTLPRGSE